MFAQRSFDASRDGGMRSRWPLIALAAGLTVAIGIMVLCATPGSAAAGVSVNVATLNESSAFGATSIVTVVAGIAAALFGVAMRSRQ